MGVDMDAPDMMVLRTLMSWMKDTSTLSKEMREASEKWAGEAHKIVFGDKKY